MRIVASVLPMTALVAASPPPAVPTASAPWREDPVASTYAPPARSDLVIRHATILDGAGRRIENGDIILHDGRIIAIGTDLPNPGNVREIEARGRWVTPGVIDVHSHDGTYVLPLTTIDKDSSDVAELSDMNVADTWIESAINTQDTAFSRALQNGVTAIQVLPGSSPIFGGHSVVLKPVRATNVAAMKFPGAPQGMKMTCGENPKGQGAESRRGPTSRQGVVTYIRRAFADAQDYLRELDGHGARPPGQAGRGGKPDARGPGGGRPPKRDMKREALAGVLSGDVKLHVHCYRSDDMAMVMNIANEFGFRIAAFHHASEAYKIPELLRAHGACAAVFGDWWGFKMEVQDAVRANAPLLDRAGVCTMMHSDSPASGQRLNIEAAKAASAGRRVGIETPPERMIAWITSQPARLLGLGDRIGTLAPGYNADVVLWSGNPFSIYSKADLVLLDGGIAYDRSAPAGEPASDFELGRRAGVKP